MFGFLGGIFGFLFNILGGILGGGPFGGGGPLTILIPAVLIFNQILRTVFPDIFGGQSTTLM
jgi:hypothetical protein